MAEENKAPEISPALKAAGYSMKNGVQPGPALVKLTHSHEEVDFRTMTVEQAERLISLGCNDLEKKNSFKESKPAGN